MPVTTRIITELSGSRKKPHCACTAGNQRNCTTSCVFPAVPVSCTTAPADMRNERKTVPGQRIEITGFGKYFPNNSIAAAPARGISGMSQMRSRKFIVPASPLQEIDFVCQHCALVSEQRDQNAQADCRLRDRRCNHEYRE